MSMREIYHIYCVLRIIEYNNIMYIYGHSEARKDVRWKNMRQNRP